MKRNRSRSFNPFGIPIYDKRYGKSFRRFQFRCMRVVKNVQEQDIALEKLTWLDLAYESNGGNWKRSVKTQLMRFLPPALHEFLITEFQLPAHNEIGKVFWNALVVSKCKRRDLRRILRDFRKQMYEMFEEKLLKDVRNSSNTEEEYLRRFLNLQNVLHICSSERVTVFLTLHCTKEPFHSRVISLISKISTKDHLKIYALMRMPDTALENMLCRAKEERFDFWGLWRGTGKLSLEYCPVIDLMLKNRSPEVFLKYGFPYVIPRRIYARKCLQVIHNRIHGGSYLDFDMYCKLLRMSNRVRIMLILETLTTFVKINVPTGKLSILQKVFRSVPHPYVTPSEMLSELEHIVPPSFINTLRMICQRYAAAAIYGEDYSVYKPRRLDHLSRCVIRKTLAENFKLPEGIDDLNIPHNLKPFLALDY